MGTSSSLFIQSVTLFEPVGYFNFYWKPFERGSLLRTLCGYVFCVRPWKRVSLFFFHYTDHCYFPRKVENEVRHLISNFAIKFPCLIRTNFGNCVIFGNSFATSHHAITGPFYGVEEVLYEAFCKSNTVEACSKTEVWSRDAHLQGGNKRMLSRVKPTLYIPCISSIRVRKKTKRIDSTSRSGHIN